MHVIEQETDKEYEALQWTGSNLAEMRSFGKGLFGHMTINKPFLINYPSLSVKVNPGDWLVKKDGYFEVYTSITFYPRFRKDNPLTPKEEPINKDFFDVTYIHSNGTKQTISYRKSAVRSVTTTPRSDLNPTVIIMDHHRDNEHEVCCEPREEVLRRLL